MKKLIGITLCVLLVALCAFALADVEISEAHFPDEYFRVIAVNRDTDQDGYLSPEEIAAVRELVISDQVEDLKGIEFFTELEMLDYGYAENVTKVDISKNTKLQTVHLVGLKLTELDISQNTELITLRCYGNRLTTLDVSNNTKLTWLDCQSNNLTALNISHNPKLKVLLCQHNQLKKLNVSAVPALNKAVRENQPETMEDGEGQFLSYVDFSDDDCPRVLVDPDVKLYTDQDILAVEALTLDTVKTTLTRTADQKKPTLQLTAAVEPEDASNPSVEWKSSNPKVAKVNQTGKVTALKAGKATITCTAKDGSGVSAKCVITVQNQLVTRIKLNKTKLSVKMGKTYQLKVKTIKPSDAFNKKVTWKSSNKKIATVDKNGKVKALKKGTCTITCTAADGSKIKATCTIKVK